MVAPLVALCRRAVVPPPRALRRCCGIVAVVGEPRGRDDRGGATRSHYAYSSPGSFGEDHSSHHDHPPTPPRRRNYRHRGFTVGIGGPVGSGKTALALQLCRHLPADCRLGVVTNDIFTQEDAEFLTRHEALPAARIRAVETGGCPHAAIREDVSSNLTALEELTRDDNHNNNTLPHSAPDAAGPLLPPCLLLCESGGDNLAANFSRELADLTLYVIDVAGGDKVPRKGGPGITLSDLLIINKIDLADAVGADLQVMQRDAQRMRTSSSSPGTVGPTLLAAVKHGQGVTEICDFILLHYRQAMATMMEEEEQEKRSQTREK